MTVEPQYQRMLDLAKDGLSTFGLMSNQPWIDDPKHVLFTLARYKFVAKMLAGNRRVLEVGCGDAFGTRLVLQEVKHLTATDIDQTFVDDVNNRMDKRWAFECKRHDFTVDTIRGHFEGAFALDVIEHID